MTDASGASYETDTQREPQIGVGGPRNGAEWKNCYAMYNVHTLYTVYRCILMDWLISCLIAALPTYGFNANSILELKITGVVGPK